MTSIKGKQKAAMLLMSLDRASAAELLKGVDNKVIRDLAVELEYLDLMGLQDNRENTEIAFEFCDSLEANERFHLSGFFGAVLKNTVGGEKAEQMQTQIQNLLQKADPITSGRLSLDLRNLDKDIRNGLLALVREKDIEVANMLAAMMILWSDIPQVSDETLQKALRGVDVKKLASALVSGEDEIVEKIKSNLSARMAVKLEKKSILISNATTDEIEDARKHIVKILRDMNIKGELTFVEDVEARHIHGQYYQQDIIATNSVKDLASGINR